MKIPKYVIEMMHRSSYNYDNRIYNSYPEKYSVGYTINIAKERPYQYVSTLKKEIERLKKWVERQQGGEMQILEMPSNTHHCKQIAIVTIYDPVMQYIEKYINEV